MANSFAEVEDVRKLMAQSEKHYVLYILNRNLDDIQEAVCCAQKVFDQMSSGAPPTPVDDIQSQYNLARSLFWRFLETRQVEDIKMATDMFQQVQRHDTFPLLTDTVRLKCSQYFIISRFVRDGDLDEMLELYVELPKVFRLSPRTSLQIKSLTYNIEIDEVFQYLDRTLLRSDIPTSGKDLDSAIELSRQALTFFSRDSVKVSLFFFHLGNLMINRIALQGRLEDHNEAVSSFCIALRLGPVRLIGPCLLCVSIVLTKRYNALKRQEDLDNAFDYNEQAMKIFDAAYHAKKDVGIDSRDIGYLGCWANLADIMSCRYRATGEVKNLNAAIDASSRAVDIAETYDPQNDLPGMLNNLAMSLNLRIKRTGHTDDMRLAIDSLQRALQLWPPGDPRRMQTVLNLISFQHTQGWKLLDEDNLQGAVQHFREALPIGEEKIGVNPSMDVHFITQSVSFVHGVNFAHSTYPDRIWSKEVEEMARLYAKPNSVHPLAGVSYKILRRCHLSRWIETHDIEDIDAAIDIARCMIVRAEGRPGELVIAWSDLGDCLYERYKIREDVENCEEAVAVLLKGVRLPASIPFLRMKAGQKAVRILSELKDWVRASEVSQEIIDLLVIMNGRSLDWQDKQYWLREFSYEAPFYASIALQAGSSVCKVIDMLETCRGSILGHVIDDRTDLSDLAKAAPEKAERFRALRDEINAVIDPSQNMNSRWN